jgi:hypothetical protein
MQLARITENFSKKDCKACGSKGTAPLCGPCRERRTRLAFLAFAPRATVSYIDKSDPRRL